MTSPFSDKRICVLNGLWDDYFCLPDGALLRSDHFLWNHLVQEGFERVMFISYEGVYFLDGNSEEKIFARANHATITPSEKSISDFARSTGIFGPPQSDSSNQDSEKLKNNSYTPRWIMTGLQESPMLGQLLREVLLEEKPATAIVIIVHGIHQFHEGIQSPLVNYLTGVFIKSLCIDAGPYNHNCVIFFFDLHNRLELAEHLKSIGWGWLYGLDSQGNVCGKGDLISIGGPGKDEIHSLIERARIMDELEIDWNRREQIEVVLAAEAQCRPLRVKQIARWLKKLGKLDDKSLSEFLGRSTGNSFQHELDMLVGMENIKLYFQHQLKEMTSRSRNDIDHSVKYASPLRLNPPRVKAIRKNLNVVLKGNPGTGKTTIARLFGEHYREIGLLPLGHLVEVQRKDLVAGFVGQTALKTADVVTRAMGGVLFIDEAYDLCRGEDDTFGREAVTCLIKAMSDFEGCFSVIIAGYTNKINDFLKTNEGLPRRFAITFELPDYTPSELEQIFLDNFGRLYSDLKLATETKKILPRLFKALYGSRDEYFGNAGTVLQMLESAASSAYSRGSSILEVSDIPEEYQSYFSQPITNESGLLDSLDAMIGLDSVKHAVATIFNRISVAKRRSKSKKVSPGHFIFMGNPGTGKTTVAKLMAEQFFALGIFNRRNIHMKSASDFIKGYVGQTTELAREFLHKGLGGVIFIDEAHQLYKGPHSPREYGRDVVDVLASFTEDHREECSIIIAGYPEEISDMLKVDPSLDSKFTSRINFMDYTSDELVKIFLKFSADEGYTLEEGVNDHLASVFGTITAQKTRTFSNAREARNIFEKCLQNQANRLSILEHYSEEEASILKIVDVPILG